jgi:hypothetical protein
MRAGESSDNIVALGGWRRESDIACSAFRNSLSHGHRLVLGLHTVRHHDFKSATYVSLGFPIYCQVHKDLETHRCLLKPHIGLGVVC